MVGGQILPGELFRVIIPPSVFTNNGFSPPLFFCPAWSLGLHGETVSNRGVRLRHHYCQHVCWSWRQTLRVSLCNRMQSDSVLESRDIGSLVHTHIHTRTRASWFIHTTCVLSHQWYSAALLHPVKIPTPFMPLCRRPRLPGALFFRLLIHHSYIQFS